MLFKLLSTIISLCIICASSLVQDQSITQFSNFIKNYNKDYSDSELVYRLSVFSENLKMINDHNVAGHSWTMGVNQFADLTSEEFKTQHTCLNRQSQVFRKSYLNFIENNLDEDLPESFDWVEKGAVTGVKDQGQCGSCWAFSSIGSIEGAYFLSSGKLVSLSESQLVDCSSSYGNQGCNGGLFVPSFEYAEVTPICSEQDYPYVAVDGKCKQCTGVTKVDSYVEVSANSEIALQQALLKNPVSVAVVANGLVWQFYNSGIVSSGCPSTQIDHGVILTAYGTDNGQDFWKIKNSWGNLWGENGFIRLARNVTQEGGMCGITSMASYPVITSKFLE